MPDRAGGRRALAQERGRDTTPGAVVIWPSEVRHLIDALTEAAAYLAEEAAGEG